MEARGAGRRDPRPRGARGSGWTRRRRSWPRWAPPPRPFRPRARSPLGGRRPGAHESAQVSDGPRSPKGHRPRRRLLNQVAHAAVKANGTLFELRYRRYGLRLGHQQTIGLIAPRLGRLIWLVLHQSVRYEERGPAPEPTVSATPDGQNDPATPKPRLSRRTGQRPVGGSFPRSAGIFDPAPRADRVDIGQTLERRPFPC